MAKITGFTFFCSYHESLKDLDQEDRRDMLEAIVNYVFDDLEPDFQGFKKTIWTLILPNLNTSKNRSKNARKETNKNQKQIKSKSKKINDIHDKDKDMEKDKDKEKEKGDISYNTTIRNIYECIEENFGRTLSPMEYEKITNWQNDFGDEIIEYAVSKSVMANKRNFSYVNGILKNWKSNGYKTLQEIKDIDYNPRQKDTSIVDEIFDYNWLEDNDE